MTIDLLTEMPQITREIGLEPADLPHPSTLCLAFDRIEMEICRVLLQQSAKLHNTGDLGAIDATYFERSPASRSYCNKTEYEVTKLKATKLVDTETNVILDLHCTTTRNGSDAEICKQLARRHAGELQTLAADRGYDCTWLREFLREIGLRPLIKHCIADPDVGLFPAVALLSDTDPSTLDIRLSSSLFLVSWWQRLTWPGANLSLETLCFLGLHEQSVVIALGYPPRAVSLTADIESRGKPIPVIRIDTDYVALSVADALSAC